MYVWYTNSSQSLSGSDLKVVFMILLKNMAAAVLGRLGFLQAGRTYLPAHWWRGRGEPWLASGGGAARLRRAVRRFAANIG